MEWLMPHYPLLCLGEGDAAPRNLRTRANDVLLDSQRHQTLPLTRCKCSTPMSPVKLQVYAPEVGPALQSNPEH